MAEVKPAYFNVRHVSETKPVYVCWLDVMGSQNAMLRSVRTAANFVCKIHDAALTEIEDFADRDVRLFPVMDGVYITSPRQGPLRYFLSRVMRRLAETFLREKTPWFRFLVRGCIAYGPLVDGKDIQPQASYALANHPGYRDSILIGMPLAQAYRGENNAPPFGIFIDESARAFAGENEKTFSFIWWDWYSEAQPRLDPKEMHTALMDHFDWCKNYVNTIGYNPDRIEAHKRLADEYFSRTRRPAPEIDTVPSNIAMEPSAPRTS
jgi:hypothetical protein